MVSPPAWLIDWTQYGLLLVSLIAAVTGLVKGTEFVDKKIKKLG